MNLFKKKEELKLIKAFFVDMSFSDGRQYLIEEGYTLDVEIKQWPCSPKVEHVFINKDMGQMILCGGFWRVFSSMSEAEEFIQKEKKKHIESIKTTYLHYKAQYEAL